MPENTKLIDSETEDFYLNTSEDDRLKYGLGPLEFERNQELITRFLHSNGGTIVDVGGGPGVYSQWLAGLGFNVILVEPLQKHIDLAKQKAKGIKTRFSCILGEARNLALPDNSADLVLLHGPLYHLLKEVERLDALREAYRILKPGGVILAWAINSSASTLVGLLQGIIHNPVFFNMCKEELLTGNHVAPAGLAGSFPTAFYHSPNMLTKEIMSAGFKNIELFAVEGIVWLDGKYFETRGHAANKSQMNELLIITESNRDLIALSPHMLAVGKKV